MKDRTPTDPNGGQPIPDFLPVPRRHERHDGWSPERQRAFIAALADTGSVSRAAAMVNMASVGAYQLRRHPQAAGFRAAWAAALDFGVTRMKDIAFERAIDGALVPVISGGRLIGYRRVFNDRLLMFCLRHYGEDANGKRTTINYFSTKATAGAATLPISREDESDPRSERAERAALTQAEASTTTVRTVITGPAGGTDAGPLLDATAATLDAFAGVPLDESARAEIARALDACAARYRLDQATPADQSEHFFAVEQPKVRTAVHHPGYRKPTYEMRSPPPAGDLLVPAQAFLDPVIAQPDDPAFSAGDEERPWTMLDQPELLDEIDAAAAAVSAARAREQLEQLVQDQPPATGARPAPDAAAPNPPNIKPRPRRNRPSRDADQ